MKLVRWLWPVSLLLALCFALEGQVRAVDIADPDDSHELASAADDDFTAPIVSEIIAPPAEGRTVPAAPLALGAGRAAVSELFRPPQTARA